MAATAEEVPEGWQARSREPSLASRLKARLERWRTDCSPRALNHATLQNDLLGWWAVALIQLCFVIFKTLLRERQPLLAAVCATNVATPLALAALIRRRPQLYAAARGPLLFLASLHLSFVMICGALYGNSNTLAQHGGSPLRMLTLLLVAGPAFLLCLYALYTRLPLAWNIVALPILAAVPALLGGGPICKHMLATRGTQAPLQDLHSFLCMVHESVSVDLLPRRTLPEPLQQCWQVNAWGLLLVAAALPLHLLHGWEHALRRCRQRSRAQEHTTAGLQAADAATGDMGTLSEQRAAAGGSEDGGVRQTGPLLRPPGWRLLEAWLVSALLWRVAGMAAALLPPAA